MYIVFDNYLIVAWFRLKTGLKNYDVLLEMISLFVLWAIKLTWKNIAQSKIQKLKGIYNTFALDSKWSIMFFMSGSYLENHIQGNKMVWHSAIQTMVTNAHVFLITQPVTGKTLKKLTVTAHIDTHNTHTHTNTQSALPYPSCGYASRHNNLCIILLYNGLTELQFHIIWM